MTYILLHAPAGIYLALREREREREMCPPSRVAKVVFKLPLLVCSFATRNSYLADKISARNARDMSWSWHF